MAIRQMVMGGIVPITWMAVMRNGNEIGRGQNGSTSRDECPFP
jgi:hypothetical protein